MFAQSRRVVGAVYAILAKQHEGGSAVRVQYIRAVGWGQKATRGLAARAITTHGHDRLAEGGNAQLPTDATQRSGGGVYMAHPRDLPRFASRIQVGSFFFSWSENHTNGLFMGSDSTRAKPAPRAEGPPDCPASSAFTMIGGKWKLWILQILIFEGTQRFGALRKKVQGVTQTMLTGQLRALEADGLVVRKVYAEVPPRVEYSATADAMRLVPMFTAMHDWWKSRSRAPRAAVNGTD